MSEEKSVPEETKNVQVGCDEEDDIVTMEDVLAEECDMEENASAVLGGSDDQNCTYDAGYIPRQALYTCLTCVPLCPTDKYNPAAVCLACSYKCHEGHELVELYTKRNFRCDCGNSKFGEGKCKLQPVKEAENAENKYNQNFRGLYCICARPYPDPEDAEPDTMAQCIICEDWYHGRHLKFPANVSLNSNHYTELTCQGCMEKYPFLLNYIEKFAVNGAKSNEKADESIKVEVDDVKPEAETIKTEENKEAIPAETADEVKSEIKVEESKTEEVSTTDEPKVEPSGSQSDETKKCSIEGKAINEEENKFAVLWLDNWRDNLCTCDKCKKMYSDEKLEFLSDINDMVQTYEEAGKRKLLTSGSQYQQGLEALSSMPRTSQIDAVAEYQEMQSKLKDFLAGFAAENKVVRAEDIKEFFEELKANKRRRLDDGSVQYLCR